MLGKDIRIILYDLTVRFVGWSSSILSNLQKTIRLIGSYHDPNTVIHSTVKILSSWEIRINGMVYSYVPTLHECLKYLFEILIVMLYTCVSAKSCPMLSQHYNTHICMYCEAYLTLPNKISECVSICLYVAYVNVIKFHRSVLHRLVARNFVCLGSIHITSGLQLMKYI